MGRATRTSRYLTARAWPVLIALVSTAPAQAQFFVSTGDNLSYPVNLFPINPAAPVLDFTGNVVSIGNSGAGSFVANNGGVLIADKLSIGNSGTGSGGVTVTGLGTQIILNGANSANNGNRLEVGNWGVGSLSVTGGAVVDATQNAGGCSSAGVFCNSFIGNGAGSSGVLNIDGAGSKVSTIGFTGIGTTAVFTLANDGFNFGTPGGITNGAVNVTAGARLNTQVTVVGGGPNTPSATGTELGIGSVVVDGAGSRWVATRDTVANGNAWVGLGTGVGGQGTLIVRNGGQLTVDGTGGSSTAFDNLVVGVDGGHGNATVTGVGSNITVVGNNPIIQVGVRGQGQLSVLAGATANATFINVGVGDGTPNSGTGSMTINGSGSTVTLSGVGTPGSGASSAGFITMGRLGGSGSLTVSGSSTQRTAS